MSRFADQAPLALAKDSFAGNASLPHYPAGNEPRMDQPA